MSALNESKRAKADGIFSSKKCDSFLIILNTKYEPAPHRHIQGQVLMEGSVPELAWDDSS